MKPNRESPVGRFYPEEAEVRAYQIEHGVNHEKAKRALIRRNMHQACDRAATYEDFRVLIRALISCAPL